MSFHNVKRAQAVPSCPTMAEWYVYCILSLPKSDSITSFIPMLQKRHYILIGHLEYHQNQAACQWAVIYCLGLQVFLTLSYYSVVLSINWVAGSMWTTSLWIFLILISSICHGHLPFLSAFTVFFFSFAQIHVPFTTCASVTRDQATVWSISLTTPEL